VGGGSSLKIGGGLRGAKRRGLTNAERKGEKGVTTDSVLGALAIQLKQPIRNKTGEKTKVKTGKKWRKNG